MAATTLVREIPTFTAPTPISPSADRAAVVKNLLKIIEKEYQNGNQTVTRDKYNALLKLQQEEEKKQQSPPQSIRTPAKTAPRLPAPLYPPLFEKFDLPKAQAPAPRKRRYRPRKKQWNFKNVETSVIAVLETVASILDNLHLLSKFPMFPKVLVHLLKHTNRLWVLILVFLIRKTVSQLLNVIRKESKVNTELKILKSNSNSKLLYEDKAEVSEDNILRKYDKVLRDLKFDKMMLKIELVGNFLDLAFNVIELYNFPVPDWFMSTLNFASMGMTIYRMNKDDEYIDDDIREDLI